MPINMRENIMRVLIPILQKECDVDKNLVLHENMLLQDELHLDSVGLLTLASLVENHFGIYLEESSEQPPLTLGDVVSLIILRLQEQNEKKRQEREVIG